MNLERKVQQQTTSAKEAKEREREREREREKENERHLAAENSHKGQIENLLKISQRRTL